VDQVDAEHGAGPGERHGDKRGADVLGEPSWVRQTLTAAVGLRSMKATDLVEQLRITPQAANNRLKMLVASGGVPEGLTAEHDARHEVTSQCSAGQARPAPSTSARRDAPAALCS
jgi:hypothetical protein